MGEFAAEQLGPRVNFDSKVARLPEQKCIEAQRLLAMPELRGFRKVPLKLAQEPRGRAQFWAAAQPPLRPELPALDRPLNSGATWAQPKGGPEEEELARAEWGAAIEALRAMFDVPESWSSTFQASFSQAPSARELPALPGVARAMKWAGGDATASSIGAIDRGRAATASEKAPPEYLAVDARPSLGAVEQCGGRRQD